MENTKFQFGNKFTVPAVHYVSEVDVQPFLLREFIPAIKERVRDRFPEVFTINHTTDPDTYKKANPAVSYWVNRIINGLMQTYNHWKFKPETDANGHFFIYIMYADFLQSKDPMWWLVENIKLP